MTEMGKAAAGLLGKLGRNPVFDGPFAPLTRTTSGMPLASTTRCRLEPSFPLSVKLEPLFRAPLGLGTEEPPMLARLQSIGSCSRKRMSMDWCNLCQTPAALQSRSRRQQVMP
jgi:hypothetical protein